MLLKMPCSISGKDQKLQVYSILANRIIGQGLILLTNPAGYVAKCIHGHYDLVMYWVKTV
jgi:hypothetical protein